MTGWLRASSQADSQPPRSQSHPSPTPMDLRTEADHLFATPDSPGAIALGVAEGTRTPDGGKTAIWHRHRDPGNHVINQGTFSWQFEAASVAEAEQRGLDRLRQEAIPSLLQQAQQQGVALDIELLLQGVDLWNQAPQAGADFIHNLKHCQQVGQQGSAAVLCARVSSYHNPRTGKLEAAGFANRLEWLRQDQQRRIQAVHQTLQQARSIKPSDRPSDSPNT